MSDICVLFVSQKFVQTTLVCYKLTQATLRARLSSSLLQKCDGGNGPLHAEVDESERGSLSYFTYMIALSPPLPHYITPFLLTCMFTPKTKKKEL
jgi:hypothetical protein